MAINRFAAFPMFQFWNASRSVAIKIRPLQSSRLYMLIAGDQIRNAESQPSLIPEMTAKMRHQHRD
ncbi:hypothetical protein TH468_06200 [Thalassospira sp. MCCC 1A03138]|nr:hypothetical protein TH468_06200 [Thalassospira sp. MCCC 1A03138]